MDVAVPQFAENSPRLKLVSHHLSVTWMSKLLLLYLSFNSSNSRCLPAQLHVVLTLVQQATAAPRCLSVCLDSVGLTQHTNLSSLWQTLTMADEAANVNLDALKAKVSELAEKVKTLKASDGDNKDLIGATVQELLAAKQAYADANGGIGVDGKPFGKNDDKKKKKASGQVSCSVSRGSRNTFSSLTLCARTVSARQGRS